MGLRNDLIMGNIKRNNDEIARKKATGEKLSFGNWFSLIGQLGLLLCSIFFGVIIIWILILLLR
ncbi:MAG: hypothetical protein WC285_06235 [Candidatus Gracilibacteria bacterium]